MDLIRIQCETCQSWLKVRGEGFIGEVHACPKCGGMVLIAAPLTEPTENRPDAAVAGPPPMLGMSNTLEEVEAPADFATPGVGTGVAAADLSEVHPVEAPADSIVESVVEPTTEPVSVAVTSWAPIATTALSLMATTAILAVWWASGSDTTAVVADSVAEVEVEVAESEITRQPVEIKSPAAESGLSVTDLTTDIQQIESPEKSVDEPAETQPSFDLPPETPPTDPTLDAAVEQPAEQFTAPQPDPDTYDAAPAVIDPLSLDPTEIELVLRRGVPEASPASAPDDNTTSPLNGDLPSEPEESTSDPTLDERLAAAAKQAGIYVIRGPTDATTGPPTLVAETALTRIVPSIALREIPLDQAVQLLGQLAGTPITLDPLALQRAGVSPRRPIDLVGEEQTLGELLSMALGKSRLAYLTNGPFITVTRKGAERQREITHRLADLAGDQPDELSDLLGRLLAADQSLAVDADGKLKLDAPMALHYDLLVLCERLRQQRGLPTESKYPADLLPTESPDSGLTSLLERRTTLSFVEPTPLTVVFDHWRRVTKRSFLIDWQSLGDAGIGPRTTIECSVTNRPMQAALSGVLEPLGLAWTPAIGGSIWITTADRVHLRKPASLSPLPAEQASRN